MLLLAVLHTLFDLFNNPFFVSYMKKVHLMGMKKTRQRKEKFERQKKNPFGPNTTSTRQAPQDKQLEREREREREE